MHTLWLLFLSRLLQISLPGNDRDAAELAIALRDFRVAKHEQGRGE